MAAELDVTVGADQQQPCIAQAAGEELEQQQGRLGGPVQVVGHDDQRARTRSGRRDGSPAQCRSSSTTTSGREPAALERKLEIESKSRNRAASSSTSVAAETSPTRSATSGTTRAISEPPPPSSQPKATGSASRT